MSESEAQIAKTSSPEPGGPPGEGEEIKKVDLVPDQQSGSGLIAVVKIGQKEDNSARIPKTKKYRRVPLPGPRSAGKFLERSIPRGDRED